MFQASFEQFLIPTVAGSAIYYPPAYVGAFGSLRCDVDALVHRSSASRQVDTNIKMSKLNANI